MGWLSSLMKIGGAAAAPFTGGASLALTAGGGLLDKVGKAGQVMGGQQSGANQARYAQGQLNQGHDRNALDRYGIEQRSQFDAGDLDLRRQTHEIDSRNRNAKTALISAMLNGGMPATSIADGKASGGLAAKLRTDPDGMAAMRNLTGQADRAQMLPPQYVGGNLLQAPTLSDVPKIDIGGGKLGTLSKIMQVLGAFGGGGEDDEEKMRQPTNGGDWGGYG
jgi:hypothetical protein